MLIKENHHWRAN
jgi:hypothetical protein